MAASKQLDFGLDLVCVRDWLAKNLDISEEGIQ